MPRNDPAVDLTTRNPAQIRKNRPGKPAGRPARRFAYRFDAVAHEALDCPDRLGKDGNHRADPALSRHRALEPTNVTLLQRLLLHYEIYRRYPLRRWPAFKNACRIAFR